MENPTEPYQPDPAFVRLQWDIYYQTVHYLYDMMPRPAADTPDRFQRRFRAAVAQVSAMQPVNADEADIALQCVAAGLLGKDFVRLATANATSPPAVVQLVRQSNSLMRQAQGFRGLLQRVQAARHKREANPDMQKEDAWTAHCALGWMTEAMDELFRPHAAAASAEPAPAAFPAPVSVAPMPVEVADPAVEDPEIDNPELEDMGPDALDPIQDDIDPADARMLRLLEALPGENDLDPEVLATLDAIVNRPGRRGRAGAPSGGVRG